jgi:hypothetical protein
VPKKNQNNRIIKNLKRRFFYKTRISDKKINALKLKKSWQGNGSNSEPIIIDDLKDLHPNLKIHRNTLHYYLRNLIIYKLSCYYTQNIFIENCTIYQLKIKGCYDITLVNNKILNLEIVNSRGNTFIDNKLPQIQKLNMNNDKTEINPISRQILNPLSCCFFFLTISSFLLGTGLWYFGFLPLGFLILNESLTYYRNKTEINPMIRQLSNPLTCCLFFLTVCLFLLGTYLWLLGFIPLAFIILKESLAYQRNKRMRDKKENNFANNTKLQDQKIVFEEIMKYFKNS